MLIAVFNGRLDIMGCMLCPRKCDIDRRLAKDFCGSGEEAVVADYFLHSWEEPCISGTKGSGTVFFSGCNLKCSFCQNHTISNNQDASGIGISGQAMPPGELGKVFLTLKEQGAHNINLVTPTHFAGKIIAALQTVPGLQIPVIYNCGGYESLDTLKMLKGQIDVYLPDFKYFSSEAARKYSSAPDYPERAMEAVLEMYEQVGPPVLDGNGVIKKGLMIRHLILPGLVCDSIKIVEWISLNLPKDVYISLMSQYTPHFEAWRHPEINRKLTSAEYDKVAGRMLELGLTNGYFQNRSSASDEYIPHFR